MMLKELTALQGVSGYEKNVRNYIMKVVEPLCDAIEIDNLGNLIAIRNGNGKNKKKIMCAAHMDEIGIQIVKFTSGGFAKVRALGGISVNGAYTQRVRFTNGQVGVLSNYSKAGEIKERDFSNCYVDFGFQNKEQAEAALRIGDTATFIGALEDLGEDRVMGKALDDRAGCYILICALQQLKDQALENDVYFVFTVQEEVGLRGARVAAEFIQPDIGIAVDITGSFDTPNDMEGNAIMGKGAAIKVSDASVICDVDLVDQMIQCAIEENIPHQLDVMSGGGTDGGAMNISGQGVKVAGISIPTRYGHSPNSIVSKSDLEACYKLLSAYVNLKF